MNKLFPKLIRNAAKIKYDTPDFHVLMRGDFVKCAVTGKEIPVNELTYWDVKYQEPYIDAEASYTRHLERKQRKKRNLT